MTQWHSESSSELLGPSIIDAHLMSAACEGPAVVMRATGGQASGRFDLADGFAEIGFIDQSPTSTKRGLLSGALRAEYFSGGGARFRFETRVVGQTASDRYRLLRPRHIIRIERRVIPRVPVSGVLGASFELEVTGRVYAAAVRDLSGDGACLFVGRDAGFVRRGQHGGGWLRLPAGVALPLSFEVRHVLDYDVECVAIGVRFQNVRPVDRRRLLSLLSGLAPSTAV